MANEVRLIDMNTLWQCETCFHHYPNGCDTYCDHGESYRPAADRLVVIDPESLRPKGRWIDAPDMDEFWGELVFHKCSLCDEVQYIKTNYCPNCGADMREGYREREKANNWIPARTPPAVDERVLVLTQRGTQMVGHYSPRFGKWRVGGSAVVTHWMPLPSTEGIK